MPFMRRSYFLLFLAVIGLSLASWYALPLITATATENNRDATKPTNPTRTPATSTGAQNTTSQTKSAMGQSVSITHIVRQDVPKWIETIGTITPLQQVVVRSRIDGELLSLHFTEGGWVKKGQVLARIDPRPLEAELAQHRAQEKRDQALLNNAKVDLKRYQQLVKDEAVSSQQVDTQHALVQQYEANLIGTRALIATTELKLSYCVIHSAITGKAGFRKLDIGNYVHANDAEGLVHIAQVDPITIVFSLPEQQAMTLYRAMQTDHAQWRVEAWQRDQKMKLAEGKIISVDNQINPNTGTLSFKASLDNPQQTLIPNQFVQVRITESILKNVMTLPNAAVLTREQGNFIYQIQTDDRVKLYPVQVIYRNQDLSVISISPTESLTADFDEQRPIVLEGADKLRDASLVRYPHKPS